MNKNVFGIFTIFKQRFIVTWNWKTTSCMKRSVQPHLPPCINDLPSSLISSIDIVKASLNMLLYSIHSFIEYRLRSTLPLLVSCIICWSKSRKLRIHFLCWLSRNKGHFCLLGFSFLLLYVHARVRVCRMRSHLS